MSESIERYNDGFNAGFKAGQKVERERVTKGIGAVLTYSTSGHSKPCGQQIGANGAGEFSVIIYGDIESSCSRAKSILSNLRKSGYKIDNAHIVLNEEGYYSRQISIENCESKLETQGSGNE